MRTLADVLRASGRKEGRFIYGRAEGLQEIKGYVPGGQYGIAS